MNALLKTYRPESTIQPNTFFIQSRGLHSGRPLRKPIANCFSIKLSNEQEYDQYYGLVSALYYNKSFAYYILGTAVPFIRIGDVYKVIQQGLERMNVQPEQFEQTLHAVSSIDRNLENLQQQINLLKQLKSAHLRKLFKC